MKREVQIGKHRWADFDLLAAIKNTLSGGESCASTFPPLTTSRFALDDNSSDHPGGDQLLREHRRRLCLQISAFGVVCLRFAGVIAHLVVLKLPESLLLFRSN
jgi:hypothetical protein